MEISLFWGAIIVILANIISLAFPDTSHSDIGIKGIHIHKNVAGFVAIMCGVIMAFFIPQQRNYPLKFIAVAVMILAMVFLALTKSKTNFFALAVIIGMAPIYLLLVRGKPATRPYFILTCLACAGIFLMGASGTKLSALGALYGDPTLTNRVVIWDEVEAFIAQAPWKGNGFGAFWDAGGEWNLFPVGYYIFYNDPLIVNQSHNGYLDIMQHGGRIALILGCIVVAQTLCYSLMLVTNGGTLRRPKWIFCMLHCMLIVIMTQNLTESTMFFPSNSSSYFFLILLAQTVRWKVDLDEATNQAARLAKRKDSEARRR
ncbi:MAG: hypothetical protein OEU92_26675 [Alphaproteobacteria bacterium]|nr:hypothetical protein [Alphaproteobacteria bacterium]